MSKIVQLPFCFVEPLCVPASKIWEPFFRSVLGLAPPPFFFGGVWGAEGKGEGRGASVINKTIYGH